MNRFQIGHLNVLKICITLIHLFLIRYGMCISSFVVIFFLITCQVFYVYDIIIIFIFRFIFVTDYYVCPSNEGRHIVLV